MNMKDQMTPSMRQIRLNIRNFLLVATEEELQTELRISKDHNDVWRAECVQELIDQLKTEEN